MISCKGDNSYFGNVILYYDDQGCYVCNTSLYGDQVASGIGSFIAAIGIILMITMIIMIKRLKDQQ